MVLKLDKTLTFIYNKRPLILIVVSPLVFPCVKSEGLEQLNSSTIDELGSWCLKGWWSRAAIRHGKGDNHGNPASGHHQWHRHTEPNQWNTYQGRAEREKGLKIKQAKWPFPQASKQANAKRTMRCPQQRAQRSPLSRDEGRPLTGIVLTLTLPKLYLATRKITLSFGSKPSNVHEINDNQVQVYIISIGNHMIPSAIWNK